MDLTEQIIPLHITLASSWGDVWVMLLLMTVPGKSGVIVFGGLTLRKKLDIDIT